MTNIIFNDGINQIPEICQSGCSIVVLVYIILSKTKKNLNESDIKFINNNQYPMSFTINDRRKNSKKLKRNISINKEINSFNGLSGNIGFSKIKPYIDLT
ncbi:hypothetical protein PIROE2DRAFT_18513 [Piromyces sp. E2]|nr:hypothetical protein PIROE2DRAFT_18513 [Piromyces sp. E2]|eukprot:OUM56745.1 hypothetical protein PIROE2DRAFT_18513 [Piromyces sp. E2]